MLILQEFRQLLTYHPTTGEFTWNVPCKTAGIVINSIAGNINKDTGYIIIAVHRKPYKAHNLAWLYTTGSLPEYPLTVDHINRVRHDNRLTNLRLATASQQQLNRSVGINNTSGVIGVCKKGNKWQAYARRTTLYIGHSFEEACLIRKQWELSNAI